MKTVKRYHFHYTTEIGYAIMMSTISRTVVDLVIQSKMVRRCCVLYSTRDCYVIMIITPSLTVDIFSMFDVSVAISRILIGTTIR